MDRVKYRNDRKYWKLRILEGQQNKQAHHGQVLARSSIGTGSVQSSPYHYANLKGVHPTKSIGDFPGIMRKLDAQSMGVTKDGLPTRKFNTSQRLAHNAEVTKFLTRHGYSAEGGAPNAPHALKMMNIDFVDDKNRKNRKKKYAKISAGLLALLGTGYSLRRIRKIGKKVISDRDARLSIK
jgi:hypothetical protein